MSQLDEILEKLNASVYETAKEYRAGELSESELGKDQYRNYELAKANLMSLLLSEAVGDIAYSDCMGLKEGCEVGKCSGHPNATKTHVPIEAIEKLFGLERNTQ
jgi:hypothetical protein